MIAKSGEKGYPFKKPIGLPSKQCLLKHTITGVKAKKLLLHLAMVHTANVVHTKEKIEEETIAAIANLATATASDRTTTAGLTETNSQITSELKQTQAKLVESLETINCLTNNPVPRQPLCECDPNKTITCPLDCHYCWTHGNLSLHTSARCPEPVQGHQKFTTAHKANGGSQKNKEEWMKRVTKVEN